MSLRRILGMLALIGVTALLLGNDSECRVTGGDGQIRIETEEDDDFLEDLFDDDDKRIIPLGASVSAPWSAPASA